MERWNGRLALVTGASSGIGAEICRILVKYGINVVGCARNVQKIQSLATDVEVSKCKGKLHAIKCDLSNESEILSMFEEICNKYGRIDICINNAGFSTDSPLLTGRTEDWRRMFEVNVLAVCICTREAVKLMEKQEIDEGQIINISSLGGHKIPEDTPAFNFYCGTKSMLRAITEGLRLEIKSLKTHIRVSSICPGLVETEFLSKSWNPEIASYVYSSMKCLEPKDIAEAVVYILVSSPHMDVTEMIVQPVEKKKTS